MDNVITFVPQNEATFKRNLNEFIDMCRNKLDVFGRDLPFDEVTWDITEYIYEKGARNTKSHIHFTNHEANNAGRKSTNKKQPLHEAFAPFAKAYIRYHFISIPTRHTTRKIYALKLLETVLREFGDPSPLAINTNVLDRAAALAKIGNSQDYAYTLGHFLEGIAAFMKDNRFIDLAFYWKNPISPPEKLNRVGKQFLEAREKKLPTQEVIDACGEAFVRATRVPDVLATSVLAIMLCQPARISEPFRLPLNCLLERDDGKEGVKIRWWPVKKGVPDIKPVPLVMSSVAKNAVKKLAEIGAPARLIARWYEENPGKIYLAPNLEYLRPANTDDKMLSWKQVGNVLWGDDVNAANVYQWMHYHGVAIASEGRGVMKKDDPRRANISFRALEKAILALLPDDFPIADRESGMKYSEALIVLRRREMNGTDIPFQCMIDKIGKDQVNRLFGRKKGAKSIFERLGITHSDGCPVSIGSHQPRHFLNTLAQISNLDDFSIAKWSGRKDVRQNKVYDHESGLELLERGEQIAPMVPAVVPVKGTIQKRYIPILRAEVNSLNIPIGHITELGWCEHIFAMSPCPSSRRCISCTESCYIKGDQEKEAFARLKLEQEEKFLEKAVQAAQRGVVGASAWVEDKKIDVQLFRQLCLMYDDPNIPDGSVIRLDQLPEISSKILDALRTRQMLENPNNQSVADVKSVELSNVEIPQAIDMGLRKKKKAKEDDVATGDA